MSQWRRGKSQRRTLPGWSASIVAGAVAGMVAGLASVGAEILTHSQLPPRIPTFWSAFVAGILGGIVYALLGRSTRRPAAWLWVVALTVATIDTLLITNLPLPAGEGLRLGIPIYGLDVPVRQFLALAGIGHLGDFRLPAWSLGAYAIVHYINAVAVSLLVPWWAGPRNR